MTWALPAIAVVLLGFVAISGRVAGTPITAPIVFTVSGFLLGGEAVGVVDVHATAEIVKLLAEVTLALVLFSDASTWPNSVPRSPCLRDFSVSVCR